MSYRKENKMTRAEAVSLQAEINAILDQAATEPNEARIAMGAVNWGDLGCTDIELRQSLLFDEDTIVVRIEEASPDAIGLRDYVQAKLGRVGIFMSSWI